MYIQKANIALFTFCGAKLQLFSDICKREGKKYKRNVQAHRKKKANNICVCQKKALTLQQNF
jgi:hypothetical protein